MNLTQLVQTFKTVTGRLDLSDDEIVNTLNDSCRLLDDIEDSDLRMFRFFSEMQIDEYIITLAPEVRYVQSVTIHQDGGSYTLTRARPDVVRSLLRESSVCSDAQVFATTSGGVTQDFAAGELPEFMDSVDLQTTPDDWNQYLLVYPKVSAVSVAEITALTYSTTLSYSAPENGWSKSSPQLIIQAAHYLLTKDLLNIDESSKILKDLQYRVQPISYDQYAVDSFNQMEG